MRAGNEALRFMVASRELEGYCLVLFRIWGFGALIYRVTQGALGIHSSSGLLTIQGPPLK